MVDWAAVERMEAYVRPGRRVRVKEALLPSPPGALLTEAALARRVPGVTGNLYGPVPGHGGDLWWVVQDGTAQIEGMWDKRGVAPYGLDEMIPYENREGPEDAG